MWLNQLSLVCACKSAQAKLDKVMHWCNSQASVQQSSIQHENTFVMSNICYKHAFATCLIYLLSYICLRYVEFRLFFINGGKQDTV